MGSYSYNDDEMNYRKKSIKYRRIKKQLRAELKSFQPCCLEFNQLRAEHLFFNCSKTLPLWWESMSWVNLITVMPQNHRDHFLQHGMEVADGVRSKTWKCWWIALTWTIWHHRNKVVFQDTTFHGTKLLEDAIFLLWSWIKAMDKDFTLHFNQWSSNLKEGFRNQEALTLKLLNCYKNTIRVRETVKLQ